MIIKVDCSNVADAAKVHSISWKESHKAFCTPDFIQMHSPERQQNYLQEKMDDGSAVFMLVDNEPVAVVSITDSLIEDLYVLPEMQNRGYGSELLRFAISKCESKPTLWILENNHNARRLYERMGFKETGNRNVITDKLDEIEFSL